MRFSYTNAETKMKKKMNFPLSHPKKFRSPAIEIPLHKRRNKKNEKIKFSLKSERKKNVQVQLTSLFHLPIISTLFHKCRNNRKMKKNNFSSNPKNLQVQLKSLCYTNVETKIMKKNSEFPFSNLEIFTSPAKESLLQRHSEKMYKSI